MYVNMYLLIISALCLLFVHQCVCVGNNDICKTCDCWKPTNQTLTVNCANRNLSKILPDWPIEKHLIISFANNQIHHLKRIPVSRAKVSLSLKNCSIRTIEVEVFLDANNIEYLDLSWNLLEQEDLNENTFRGPYNDYRYEPIGLREINLSYNSLRSIDPNIFLHTPNLTYLDLSGNPLGTLTNDFWSTIISLKYLNSLILVNTSMEEVTKGTTVEAFKNGSDTITHLDISHNNIKDVPVFLKTMLPSLETLIINGNPIDELTDQSFSGFKKLRSLHISNMTRLRRIRHHTFHNLPELQYLYLSNNHLLTYINEFAFGKDFGDPPPLVELYLNDNNLKELNPSLLNWTSLSTLQTDGNHWICHCDQVPSVHCGCEGVQKRTILLTNIEFTEALPDAWSSTKVALAITALVLCSIAGVIIWRILVTCRRFRLVNAQYPVIYTSVASGF